MSTRPRSATWVSGRVVMPVVPPLQYAQALTDKDTTTGCRVPENGAEGSLDFQLHHRSSRATFILLRLSNCRHMRMVFQKLAQRFPQDAHAPAVDDPPPHHPGEHGALLQLLHFLLRLAPLLP